MIIKKITIIKVLSMKEIKYFIEAREIIDRIDQMEILKQLK